MSTLLESARKQRFFAQHLPSLTDVVTGNKDENTLQAFLARMTFTTLA